MFWLNIKELEKSIIEGKLTDEAGFKYFLANMIVLTIATYTSNTENFIISLPFWANLIITIWGSQSIFKANSSGDKKDFFKRYFALSWVYSFRLGLIFLGILAILVIIVLSASESMLTDFDASNPAYIGLDVIFTIIYGVLYYNLLTKSFKRVSALELPENIDNA